MRVLHTTTRDRPMRDCLGHDVHSLLPGCKIRLDTLLSFFLTCFALVSGQTEDIVRPSTQEPPFPRCSLVLIPSLALIDGYTTIRLLSWLASWAQKIPPHHAPRRRRAIPCDCTDISPFHYRGPGRLLFESNDSGPHVPVMMLTLRR